MTDEVTPRERHLWDATVADAAQLSRGHGSAKLPSPGYLLGAVIGRGGMGEVIAARDHRIGREVAVKRMTSGSEGESVTRFLREARIQARLDHPAIVPVYELGIDKQDRPYFVMKRLSGDTLAQRLAEGQATKPMLRALVDVCLAVELAHSRGVVHRDLKPSNIMLGTYGEVYVLDWGIARVLDAEQGEFLGGTTPAPLEVDTLDDGTRPGALLGTPGYMSPEQIKGEGAIGSADVYALGAILFEIVAREPLHPRGNAAIASTLGTPQVAPSERCADVPPELDTLCFEALAEDAGQRPTARQLADRIQAYLDGDRDLILRRDLGAIELVTAREALGSDRPDAREAAIHHAGRALALDPRSDAAALVSSLVLEPPKRLPPALASELDRDERTAAGLRAKRGTVAYFAVLAFWAFIPFLDVRSWSWLLAFNGVLGALAVLGWRASRRGQLSIPYAMAGNLVLGILMTRIAGPFLLTPLVICGALLAFSADRWTMERPWTLVVWSTITVMLPFALEWSGLLAQTWEIDVEGFTTRSAIYESPGSVAAVALVAANLVFVCVVGLYALAINRAAHDARRTLRIQAWHLQHLLPSRQ